MGGVFSSLRKALKAMAGKKDMRLLMLGLDNAGKTTILFRLRDSAPVTTVPTVGFECENIKYKNINFNVWDVGGQDKIRPLWRHYYSGTDALIFVVDANDRERMNEAKNELQRIVTDPEMQDIVVLIYANKQDVANALTPNEITEILDLPNMLADKNWNVQASCAKDGTGLADGLNWISETAEK